MNKIKPDMDLIEAKKRLQAVIDTALDGIITIDEQGKIESINQAGADIFCYTQQELIGQNVNILMPENIGIHHDQYIDNYLRTGEAKIIGTKREVHGRKKDGTIVAIRLAISKIDMQGQMLFMGIIHDLTDEKIQEDAIIQINMDLEKRVAAQTFELQSAVEKLLESNKQLEKEIEEKTRIEEQLIKIQKDLSLALEKEKELNEMKSRFISMTSHEFRTPLSTIFSSASIIDKYPHTEQHTNRTKHTKKIRKSVTMLINVLDEFLNISRLEKDIVLVRNSHSPYSVKEFCQEIIQELESILKKEQHIFLKANGKDFINLDPSILKQILYNILSNAIKYSGEGTSIEVGTKIDNNILFLEVKDEGMGIPEEEQNHLFTRFFRASNALHIQGTGLGLNLVLHYLNLLNGRVSFESELNEGTNFRVEIPV